MTPGSELPPHCPKPPAVGFGYPLAQGDGDKWEKHWSKNVAARHPQEPLSNDREVQKFRSMADRETCWKI